MKALNHSKVEMFCVGDPAEAIKEAIHIARQLEPRDPHSVCVGNFSILLHFEGFDIVVNSLSREADLEEIYRLKNEFSQGIMIKQ